MRGVMYVARPDEPPLEPSGLEEPGRQFVKMWTVQDLADEAADLSGRSFQQGREMFHVAGCSKCHAIAGEGSKLAPDLTEVHRRFQGAKLLEQILNPSARIHEDYQTYAVVTTRGESISGLVIEKTPDAFHLLPNPLLPEEITIVRRADVEEMQPSLVSTMPKGLLLTLEKDEILDLLYFLEAGGKSPN